MIPDGYRINVTQDGSLFGGKVHYFSIDGIVGKRDAMKIAAEMTWQYGEEHVTLSHWQSSGRDVAIDFDRELELE